MLFPYPATIGLFFDVTHKPFKNVNIFFMLHMACISVAFNQVKSFMMRVRNRALNFVGEKILSGQTASIRDYF